MKTSNPFIICLAVIGFIFSAHYGVIAVAKVIEYCDLPRKLNNQFKEHDKTSKQWSIDNNQQQERLHARMVENRTSIELLERDLLYTKTKLSNVVADVESKLSKKQDKPPETPWFWREPMHMIVTNLATNTFFELQTNSNRLDNNKSYRWDSRHKSWVEEN